MEYLIKIATATGDRYFHIEDGSGDNLLAEDRKEGYIDYINLDEVEYSPEDDIWYIVDGGMVMFSFYWQEEFKTPDELIRYLVENENLPEGEYEYLETNNDTLYI